MRARYKGKPLVPWRLERVSDKAVQWPYRCRLGGAANVTISYSVFSRSTLNFG